MKKILFILKERHYSPSKNSYGLINSANHIADYLNSEGYVCKVVSVIDANFIDREVHRFEPDRVIIEALWVPVHKMKELLEIKRYRLIRWVVRVHSDIGFLATESQGIKLLNEYVALKNDYLTISLNNFKFNEALTRVLNYPFIYLPNIITIQEPEEDYSEEQHQIKIGCFGATRLLKNQCFQAICAIEAAHRLKKRLYFHITPNLGEKDDPVLKNLQELFKNGTNELVVHSWMDNHKFQRLIRKMDIGLQLSYTESFNIVTADFINNNKLIVVSDAIDWLPEVFHASTTDYEEAVKKIVFMYYHRNSKRLKAKARNHLVLHNYSAKFAWNTFLNNIIH